MIFNNGVAVERTMQYKDHTYKFKFHGNYNRSIRLRDIIEANSWPFIDFLESKNGDSENTKLFRSQLYDTKFIYVKEDNFDYIKKDETDKFKPSFLLIPPLSLLKALFFSTPRMVEYQFNPSFSFNPDIVFDYQEEIFDNGQKEVSLITIENYKPYDFHVIANILSNPNVETMFKHCQNRLRDEYFKTNKEFYPISAYIPANVKSFALYGKKVQINDTWGLLAYDLSQLSIKFSYDFLNFASLISGEQGANKDDENLEKRKNYKRNPDEPGNNKNPTSDHDDSFPFEELSFNDSILGIPSGERMSKEKQKYKVETLIKEEKKKDITTTSKEGSNPDGPAAANVDNENKDDNIEREIINNLKLFFESMQLLENDFKISNRVVHQEADEVLNREYYKILNTIPLYGLDKKAKHFACFTKVNRNNWSGRRGVIIIEAESNGKIFYILEIEPRIREKSAEHFTTLVFSKNSEFIDDNQLLSLIKIVPTIEGKWRKNKATLDNLQFNYIICKHSKNRYKRIKKAGLELLSKTT
ncbi:hypothetical protein [Marivirga sericea]|nr:hypothetical protein [Marivirga sericea]